MGNENNEQPTFPNSEELTSQELTCVGVDVSICFAAKRGYKASCLDISETASRVAWENFHQGGNPGRSVQTLVIPLPLRDNTSDKVLCTMLSELPSDVQTTPNDMTMALKPGGLFPPWIGSRTLNWHTLHHGICRIVVGHAAILRSPVGTQVKKGFSRVRSTFPLPHYFNLFSLPVHQRFTQKAGLTEFRADSIAPFPALSYPQEWLHRAYQHTVIGSTGLTRKSSKTRPQVTSANWSVF